VSKERDGMISPEVQRVAISDYAAARGYEVTGWLEGIDESGSRAHSAWWPRLDQAVAAVETGEFDVILVWKYSRVARHRLRWAVAIDRVEDAGGRLESATEQFDTTTSSGRLARGMLAELQAFEAERIGEVWKDVHKSRVTAGKPPTGKPKWGYGYDRALKLHVPDPETGPVLADLYRRYVAGESVYSLVRWLNGHGWRTLEGGSWSDRSLRRVLDSGFASGRFLYHGDLHPGVHEPLVDEQLWQAYLDARAARRHRPARSVRSQYLLSGLVRCGRCDGPMVAGQFGNAHEPKYRCKAGKEKGPEVCTGGYVMASYLERLVLEDLQRVADLVDEHTDANAASTARRTAVRSETRRLAREIRRLEDAMGRLAVQHAKSPLPEQVQRRAQKELAAELAGLQAALEDAERDLRGTVQRPSTQARRLLESWETRPVEHRREALRQWFIREIRVWSGRPRAEVAIVHAWD
jgi:site-specific DNA recombinase